MKTWLWAGLMAATMAVTLAPTVSEAKRLGGGKSLGMQRTAPPPKPAAPVDAGKPAATPGTAAAPAAAAAPAVAPKRNWMGPLAGLAAGLGIAALMSHLGMGAAFGNLLTFALVALVAFFAIRFLMQRFGRGAGAGAGGRMAMAGAGAGSGSAAGAPEARRVWPDERVQPAPAALQRTAEPTFGSGAGALAAPAAATATATGVPADFDSAGFERIAKMIFIRLQAANDKSDLNDLRNFTTPEMFAEIRLELQERGPSAQQTDVVRVDAEVIEFAQEIQRQLVSVRFHGLIREDIGGVANDFDEVWHLAKADGAAAWAIAGIQQRQPS